MQAHRATVPSGFWCKLPALVIVFGLVATNGVLAGPIVTTCPSPMIPRRALPDDTVCVMPDSALRVAAENARGPLLWIPGPFGPKTCADGYVWREATTRDFTCVTPAIRTLVRAEQSNPQLAPDQ